MNKVCVIIVNWNGWKDTIECLESIFRSCYPDFQVVVCDNDSEDSSLEHIKAWAENQLSASVPRESPLRHLTFPPLGVSIPYAEYSSDLPQPPFMDVPLVLIQTGANLGFAGANNVGMRYVLSCGVFDYVWLLNNDTVVRPDTLAKLVQRMEEKTGAGMCGATLLYYNRPDKVQALGGGYYCKWIGLPWHQGRLKKASDPVKRKRVEAWMNYIVGASILVSRQFLEDIGLMCEDYFLYFEETDWAMRAKGKYSLAYAPEAVVYHKVGASIGTSSDPRKKSLICDYYNIRNRLFFTGRYFPFALPTVYLVLIGTLLTRCVLGKWDRAKMILKLMLNFRKICLEFANRKMIGAP